MPREAAALKLRERGRADVVRINELEAKVRHDVIAFTIAVQESVGDPGNALAASRAHVQRRGGQQACWREASQRIGKRSNGWAKYWAKARGNSKTHRRLAGRMACTPEPITFRPENCELVFGESARSGAVSSGRAANGGGENFRRGGNVHAPGA